MNDADRDRRDNKIEKLFRAGVVPGDISSRVHLKVDRVRNILEARGLLVPKPFERLHEGMWSADRDTLARRIWQRQRDGARAALRAMGRA